MTAVLVPIFFRGGVTLVHSAKAVARNKMTFLMDILVASVNIVVDCIRQGPQGSLNDPQL